MTEPRPDRPSRRTAAERIVRTAPRRPRPTAPPPQEPNSGVTDVLRNRPFLLLWLAQVATQVGGNMVLYGLTVVASAYSNTAVAALFLSYLVPAVIFSAVAGVYVDQVDRRHMLVVTNILRGIAYLAIFLIGNNLLLMYPLVIFVATVTTFFGPAEASMIPTLVPRRQLVPANGLFTLTMNVAFALGFAFFGPIVTKIFGPSVLLLVVGALYFVAAVFCWTLPPSPPAEAPRPTAAAAVADAERAVESMIADFREGIEYIHQNASVGWALGYQAITASLIGVLGVLGPDFANKALGLSKGDFFVVVLPLGFGLAFGILLLNSYGRYLPRRRVIEGGLISLGVILAVLSVSGPVARFLEGQAAKNGLTNVSNVLSLLSIVIVLGFLAGIAYAFVAISAQTQLQEDVQEDVRGRIFGVLQMLVSIASFLPIIIVGPIADLIGVPAVFLAVAVLTGLAGVYSVIRRGPLAPEEASVRAPSEPVGAPVDFVTVAIGGGEVRTLAVDRATGHVTAAPLAASPATAARMAGDLASPGGARAAGTRAPAVAEEAAATSVPDGHLPADYAGALAEAIVAERAAAETVADGEPEATPEAAVESAAETRAAVNAPPPEESTPPGEVIETSTWQPDDPREPDAAVTAAATPGDARTVAPLASQPAPEGRAGHGWRRGSPQRGVIRRSPLDPEPGTSLGERLRQFGDHLFRRSDGDGEP